MKPVNSCATDLPAMLPRQDNLVCEICAKVSLAMSAKGTDEGPDGRMLVHTSDRLKTGNWRKLAPATPPQPSILLLQWCGCQKKKQLGS
jgi:hypothetical protein